LCFPYFVSFVGYAYSFYFCRYAEKLSHDVSYLTDWWILTTYC